MSISTAISRQRQRGITLIGLLFWAFMLCVLALVGMKVTPAVLEYQTISGMVNKAAKEGGSTVAEIRSAYDRAAQIEYGNKGFRHFCTAPFVGLARLCHAPFGRATGRVGQVSVIASP